MQIVTGIVLLLKFCLAGIVGVRLLRISDRGSLSPESCLGWFFLSADVLAGVTITAAYAIWSTAGQAVSSGVTNHLHGTGQLGMTIGYAMVLLFTQQTFYPVSKSAAMATWVVIAGLVVSFLGRFFAEGFAISLDPGPFHWMGFYFRMFALLGASAAALRYWLLMKRRSALGLADPIIANRFLLWSLWASGNLLAAFSEPVARFVYGWLTGADAGAAESIQLVGGSLITITLALTSVLGLATTVILFLAFFPTAGYQNWITARAASQRA